MFMYSGLTRMFTVLGDPGTSTPSSLTLTVTSPGTYRSSWRCRRRRAGRVVTARCVGETLSEYLDASPGRNAAWLPRLSRG